MEAQEGQEDTEAVNSLYQLGGEGGDAQAWSGHEGWPAEVPEGDNEEGWAEEEWAEDEGDTEEGWAEEEWAEDEEGWPDSEQSR